jgi:two-component system sensor histidine kinase PilS (NtrC family)
MKGTPGAGAGRPEALAPEFAWRTLRLLNAFRMLTTAFLFALYIYPTTPRFVGDAHPEVFLAAVLSGFLFAAINDFAVNQHWPAVRGQCVAQALVDITVIALLTWASGGLDSGIGNLLIISIGGVAFILPRIEALAFASAATLAVLGIQAEQLYRGVANVGDFSPAGLLGGLLMLLAIAAAPLARRIHESEALARQRGVDLENLSQLNEYIVQNLRESIVVVDSDDKVRLMNEAAAGYLGVGAGWRGVHLSEISPRLLQHAQAWRAEGDRSAASSPFPSVDGTTMISPFFAPIGRPRSGALLVFLEDLSLVSEKIQQSKLAALGRLSASIAHEIRNPVGALSHAAQLLEESENLSDGERRLTTIIESNAQRVSDIVENVLQLSRRESVNPERLDIVGWTRQFLEEFRGSAELSSAEIVFMAMDEAVEVRMDSGHLFQIMTNLCENAIKHAETTAGGPAIEVAAGRRSGTGRPFLEVRDRGPGIPADAADRIFEPFFRVGRERGGSGLGLFISRELAEVNRAALSYEPRGGGGSIFRIIFSDPQRWET